MKQIADIDLMLWRGEFTLAPHSEALNHARLFVMVQRVNVEKAFFDNMPVTIDNCSLSRFIIIAVIYLRRST